MLAVTTWLPTRARPHLGSFVLRDARALADAGHEVAVVHLVPPGQLRPRGRDGLSGEDDTPHGIPVTRLVMSTTSPRQIAAAGHRLSQWSRGADVVHTMAFSTLLALSWWRPRSPWVHTEHWSGISSPQLAPLAQRAALPGLRPLLRRPDVVTAVTGSLVEPVRRIRGDRPTRVVPCIAERPVPLVSRRGDQPGEPLRLVSVGGLIERKNPLLAVDTLGELVRRGTPARLRFVGEGPLAQQIRQRAAESDVTDLVDLVGVADARAVASELGDADVFIGPTRGENFFVACAEAVLAGRPVVVGANGGHVAYLDDRVARCVSAADPEAFADAVGDVLTRSRGMSAEQVSATIGDQFTPRVVAGQYAEAYDLAARTARTESATTTTRTTRAAGSA